MHGKEMHSVSNSTKHMRVNKGENNNNPVVIFDRLIHGYEQQAYPNLTIRVLLTVMPASMTSRASVFSSSVSSPSKIPLIYDPNTPSSVFRACNFLLSQVSKEFVATAMFGCFTFASPSVGNTAKPVQSVPNRDK